MGVEAGADSAEAAALTEAAAPSLTADVIREDEASPLPPIQLLDCTGAADLAGEVGS